MRAYQKIQQPYKEEVKEIWKGIVTIEEKVDGSQFRIEINDHGVISCGSHHQDLSMVDSMFTKATENAKKIFEGYQAYPGDVTTVFCEYLSKPKQNAIPYARVPKHNLVIFDVIIFNKFLNRKDKERFAKHFGMEVVPLIYEGPGESVSDNTIKEWLTLPSFLGHQAGFNKIEGLVVKNYNNYYDIQKYPQYQYLDHPWLCTKIVNDEFKEKNREENPNRGNDLQKIKDAYRSEARARKAYQHCLEKGLIKGEMADLQHIVPEFEKDIVEEDKEVIKDALWRIFGKEITGYAKKILPQWYKDFLIEKDKNETQT